MERRRLDDADRRPEWWRGMVEASHFVRDNAESIGQCTEAARTAGADQRCTITVKALVR
jgi:hypothetical protein|tara:strand:- start:7040 stop:7216 length:177 start_codon:yes stop_codon:yes gene_type:complete